MWLSSIHDGAEAQLVQGSTALFEFSGTARTISAPSSQGHVHSFLLWTGDSAALINPLKPSLKMGCRWIASCTEGEDGPDCKVCLHVVRDPRYKAYTPVVVQREIAAPPLPALGACCPFGVPYCKYPVEELCWALGEDDTESGLIRSSWKFKKNNPLLLRCWLAPSRCYCT